MNLLEKDLKSQYKYRDVERIWIEEKYQGYIDKEAKVIKNAKKMSSVHIPESYNFKNISGLSREVCEKLSEFRPENLGQASRISGVTPAAIQILQVHLNQKKGLSLR